MIFDTSDNRVYQDAASAGLDTLNWQLTSGSPLIDASDGTSPAATYDYYYVSRPQGAASDIGALEYVSGEPAAAHTLLYNNPIGLPDVQPAFTVTPNPVTDMVQINGGRNIRWVTLYNALGQRLRVLAPAGDGSILFSMSSLPEGIYLLQIMDVKGNARTVKLMKH